jgi:hypothetical protein
MKSRGDEYQESRSAEQSSYNFAAVPPVGISGPM